MFITRLDWYQQGAMHNGIYYIRSYNNNYFGHNDIHNANDTAEICYFNIIKDIVNFILMPSLYIYESPGLNDLTHWHLDINTCVCINERGHHLLR